jgi:hypothetical protein
VPRRSPASDATQVAASRAPLGAVQRALLGEPYRPQPDRLELGLESGEAVDGLGQHLVVARVDPA